MNKKMLAIANEARNIALQTERFEQGLLDEEIIGIQNDNLIEIATHMNQLTKIVNGNINDICRVLSHLSIGDLGVRPDKKHGYPGDFHLIFNALQKISKSLSNTFTELRDLSGCVDEIGSRVAGGSKLLAENSAEQSNQIENLNESIHIMRESVNNNLLHINEITEYTTTAQMETQDGIQQMNQLLTEMKQMNHASNEIKEVIQMIADISEETKLLALNASIEAARAGELGKGFAVVAEAIGKLAVQTSGAVSKTTELINRNNTMIVENNQLVDETAKSFSHIADAVNKIGDSMNEVRKSAKDELVSIDHTTTIADEILSVVEENVKSSENSADLAFELNKQTSNLKELISEYHLDKDYERGRLSKEEQCQIGVLLKKVTSQLALRANTEEINRIMLSVLREHRNLECMYLLDANGIQISDTVMNPNMEENKEYQGTLIGTDHSTSIYYRLGRKTPNHMQLTYEYISGATNGLCRTGVYAYTNQKGAIEVLCVDITL